MRKRMRSTVYEPQQSYTVEAYACTSVCPNVALVTGRDATGDYIPGVIVRCTSTGRMAGVVNAKYSGGNTYVTLSSDILPASGVVGLERIAHGLANSCSGGTALSGGDTWAADGAFDGSLAYGSGTTWSSSQSATDVSGFAYIGYQFASAKNIRWARFIQASAGFISSVLLQYYNGSSWVTVTTYTCVYPLATDSTTQPHLGWEMMFIPPTISATKWRLLANANPASGGNWYVNELQMGV